jgi:hypothetical protein
VAYRSCVHLGSLPGSSASHLYLYNMNTIMSLLVLGTLLLFFFVTGSTLARRTEFRFSDYRRFGVYPGVVGGLIGGATGLVFAVCALGSWWGIVLDAVLLGLVVGAFLDCLVRLVVALTRNDSR